MTLGRGWVRNTRINSVETADCRNPSKANPTHENRRNNWLSNTFSYCFVISSLLFLVGWLALGYDDRRFQCNISWKSQTP